MSDRFDFNRNNIERYMKSLKSRIPERAAFEAEKVFFFCYFIFFCEKNILWVVVSLHFFTSICLFAIIWIERTIWAIRNNTMTSAAGPLKELSILWIYNSLCVCVSVPFSIQDLERHVRLDPSPFFLERNFIFETDLNQKQTKNWRIESDSLSSHIWIFESPHWIIIMKNSWCWNWDTGMWE